MKRKVHKPACVPFNDIAYRRYLIRCTLTGDVFIEKDGFNIGFSNSIEQAKRDIDMLVGNPRAVNRKGKKPSLSRSMARRLLKESATGRKKITEEQRRLFELVAHGGRPSRLQNPREIQIAPRVDAIMYSFGNPPVPHGDCDAECKRKGHRYIHEYTKKFPLCLDPVTKRLLI